MNGVAFTRLVTVPGVLVGGVMSSLPLKGVTAGTMNWQTFSHLAFAFRVTPASLRVE